MSDVTFGDVWFCSGQSNMQLMLDYTFERNASVAAIRAGKYRNIRLFYGPMNFDYASNRSDIWVINADQAGDPVANRNQLSTGGWRHPENLVEDIRSEGPMTGCGYFSVTRGSLTSIPAGSGARGAQAPS